MKKMSAQGVTRQAKRFDPFSDRLSRDVRNSLSVAFVRSLEEKDARLIEQKAQQWLDQHLPPVYTEYIRSRVERYHEVFDRIVQDKAWELLTQAAYVWNAGLFFEVRELLEGFWRKTSGDERQALKALIQAATAYAHLDVGHQKPWVSLCAKSAKLLKEQRQHLSCVCNLNVLISKVENVDPDAPRLEVDVE